MKIRQSGILILTTLLILTACQPKVLYEKTIALPQDGWEQDNFVVFNFPVEDTINLYEISLIIRNDARYEYSNLFMFINTTAPGGQGIRDTIEVRMADERGKWYGSGIGGRYTLQVPFKTSVVFPQKGSYTIEVEQGMRKKELGFISDIGLHITKMK